MSGLSAIRDARDVVRDFGPSAKRTDPSPETVP